MQSKIDYLKNYPKVLTNVTVVYYDDVIKEKEKVGVRAIINIEKDFYIEVNYTKIYEEILLEIPSVMFYKSDHPLEIYGTYPLVIEKIFGKDSDISPSEFGQYIFDLLHIEYLVPPSLGTKHVQSQNEEGKKEWNYFYDLSFVQSIKNIEALEAIKGKVLLLLCQLRRDMIEDHMLSCRYIFYDYLDHLHRIKNVKGFSYALGEDLIGYDFQFEMHWDDLILFFKCCGTVGEYMTFDNSTVLMKSNANSQMTKMSLFKACRLIQEKCNAKSDLGYLDSFHLFIFIIASSTLYKEVKTRLKPIDLDDSFMYRDDDLISENVRVLEDVVTFDLHPGIRKEESDEDFSSDEECDTLQSLQEIKSKD